MPTKIEIPVPPKPKTYIVESTSTDPHYCGEIEIRPHVDKVELRWHGCKDWVEIEWWEIMRVLEWPDKRTTEDIQHLRERAQTEGYMWGLARALERFGKKETIIEEKPQSVPTQA